MNTRDTTTQHSDHSRRDELLTFLFLVLAMAPLLSAVLIGSYGLIIWLLE